MHKHRAFALIEFSSIAIGIQSGDAMVKRAPISVLKSGTVHDGKYLVLIGGSVASVNESFDEGVFVGGEHVIDKVLLADVDDRVRDAVLGTRQIFSGDALGIIETATVAATIRSADAGVKGANIEILEIRLADDLGGKSIATFAGRIEDVAAAIEMARRAVTQKGFWLNDTLIANLHEQMAKQIDQSTHFAHAPLELLEDGER